MRRIGWIGFAATALLVALITLTPQSDTSAHGAVSMTILRLLHSVGVPDSFGPTQWEFTANVIMFKPLGFFLALAWCGQRLWRGVILLPMISAGIELAQRLFLASRYPTIQDVVANSLGGWFGLAVGAIFIWWIHRRRHTGEGGALSDVRI